MRSSNVALLAVKEKLQENLSSSQIAETLDDLLFKFLGKLNYNTNMLEYVCVELIIHIFTNSRRKFSNTEVNDLQDSLFSFIVSENKTTKFKLLRELRLERSIYFRLLDMFEGHSAAYMRESALALKTKKHSPVISEIERKSKSINKNFYSVCTGTLFWSKRIYAFRNMIIEKYIRLARVEANKAALQTGLTVSKDDLTRGFILSLFKSLNKYDSHKGTLTNYVKTWFQDAKTNQSYHEEGVAYSIPSQSRAKVLSEGAINIYEPIDENTEGIANEESIVDTLEREQDHVVVSNLACRIDSDKVFVLLQGLRYTPTQEDIETLQGTLKGK